MKTFIKIAAVLIILVIIAFVALFAFGLSQLDAIVKAGIERGGTYATETTTTVGDVSVKLDGSFAMNEFKIANPTGFTSEHFFKLGETSVQLEPSSLASDVIAVPDITFKNIDIILDKGGDPSNYNTILNSLKRFENKDQKAAPDNAGGKKVAIDSLTLENIDIRVANMPGVSLLTGDVAINIPSIELKDIGKDEPMTAAEITNLVIKTVLTAAVEAGGGIFPTDILGDLANGLTDLSSLSDMGVTVLNDAGELVGEQLDNVLDQVNDITDGAQDAIEDLTKDLPDGVGEDLKNVTEDITDQAGEAVEEVTNEIEKGLGNLFGNKKEDD
ncbi:MAG: hypothetical protein JJ974_07400 [Phycisphaerales bacterium]|nr:hypothetical protein [Phycisphaerales bacterium]